MKIRNGFVSNSSSSSFIIMKRSAVSEQDIKNLLSTKYRDDIIDFCENDLHLCYDKPYDDEGHISVGEELYKEIIQSIAQELYDWVSNEHCSVKLDDWLISSSSLGDDDGDMLGVLVYDYIHQIDLPDFKLKSTG